MFQCRTWNKLITFVQSYLSHFLEFKDHGKAYGEREREREREREEGGGEREKAHLYSHISSFQRTIVSYLRRSMFYAHTKMFPPQNGTPFSDVLLRSSLSLKTNIVHVGAPVPQ